MTIYILNLLVSCMICFLGKRFRKSSLHLYIIFIIWVCLFTFRYRVGADSWTFNALLEVFKGRDVSFWDYMATGPRDKLFSTIYYLCIKTLGMKRVWFYMVVAVLIYSPVIKVLKEKDNDLVFSVFLYCALLWCYSGYNGTRQTIALGFCMLAYHNHLLKGKYIKYAVLMLVAYGFHSAAIFALPFHLLSLKPLKSRWVLWGTLILTALLLFLPSVWNAIIDALDALGQEKMANDYATLSSKGANYLRVLVQAIPTLIVLLRFSTLKKRFPDIEPLVVLNLLATVLSFFMLRNAIFARFVAIVDVSSIFLLPKIPYAFSEDRHSKAGELILVTMVVLYFAYMVLIIRSGDAHLYPYQFLPNLDATWH